MATFYCHAQAAGGGNGNVDTPFNNYADLFAAMAPNDTAYLWGDFTVPFEPPASLSGGGAANLTWFIVRPTFRWRTVGGQSITNWTAATGADTLLSSTTGVYRGAIAKNLLPDDPEALHLCEAGEQKPVATSLESRPDEFFIPQVTRYWTAEATSTVVSGDDQLILGQTYPASAVSGASEEQMLACTAHFVTKPNNPAKSVITSYDAVNRVAVYETQSYRYDVGKAVADKFSLRNFAPAIAQGRYVYQDTNPSDPNADLVVYYIPEDTANLSNGEIRVANLQYGARLLNCSYMTIQGLEVDQITPNQNSEAGIIVEGTGGNVTFLDTEIHNVFVTGGAYAGVVSKQDNTKFHRINESYVSGSGSAYGVFVQGNGAANADAGNPELVNTVNGFEFTDFTMHHVYSAGIRVYTARDVIIAFGVLWKVGAAAHANLMNAYQGCYRWLVYGILAVNSEGGFLTWQESSDIIVAMCALRGSTATSGGNKAIANQNNAVLKQATLPGNGFGGSYFYNNVCQPLSYRIDGRYDNSVKTSHASEPNDNGHMYNTLYFGSKAEEWSLVNAWENNILATSGTPNAPSALPAPWNSGHNNEWVTPASEWTDAAAGDYSYPAGSRIRAKAGFNMQTLITNVFAPRHPTFLRWHLDMFGNTIDWNNAFIGPTSDFDADLNATGSVVDPGTEPEPTYPECPSETSIEIIVDGS